MVEAMLTDPIADMFTRIRNAIAVKKDWVEIPISKLKMQIARVLKDEGFIEDWKIEGNTLKIKLKYFYPERKVKVSVIRGIRKVSKPGRRVYIKSKDIKEVYSGTGIMILSTSIGILSNNEAKAKNVGGEVIGEVW